MPRCSRCGAELPPPLPDGSQANCPFCEVLTRDTTEVVSGISLSEGLAAHAIDSEGRTKSVDEVTVEGFRQVADRMGPGVEQTTEGAGTQNEEGVEKVGRLLARAWSEGGAHWEATPSEKHREYQHRGDVDVVLCCTTGDQPDEPVQVTRVVPDGEYWKAANRGVPVKRTYQSDELGAFLVARARAKGPPKFQTHDLVLALDATQFPAAAFDGAVEAARARGPEIRALGFRQVWVVGPLTGLTFRLD